MWLSFLNITMSDYIKGILNDDDRRRYSRTIDLDDVGVEGQRRLAMAHVAIVGAGALGSAVAVQLAAAGVGRISVADFDKVDISNLQRQPAYNENAIGKYKTDELTSRLLSLNHNIDVKAMRCLVSRKNIEEFINDADLIVDGSDNAATKQMICDVARTVGIPCVVGGVSRYVGQVMTFLPSSKISYAEIFGNATGTEVEGCGITGCNAGGIFSPLPTIVAAIQASEVIKIIVGIGKSLSGRLFVLDTRTMTPQVFSFE